MLNHCPSNPLSSIGWSNLLSNIIVSPDSKIFSLFIFYSLSYTTFYRSAEKLTKSPDKGVKSVPKSTEFNLEMVRINLEID